MGGSANSAFDGDHLVLHAGEVQFAGQFLQRAAFLGNSGDVVLLQQLHGLCSGLAVTIPEVIEDLSDDFCVDFG